MIYRIIGRGGIGKTEYILEAVKQAYLEGKECIFLTPEQQSITMEKKLCDLLGSGYNLNVEVLNFERLPDRVFRENGGVTLSRADSKTLSLFTALACENAKDKLLSYENSALDREFTKKISSTIERMGECNVTPKDLLNATSHLDEENSVFKDKLYDVAQIFFEYSEILKKGYADSTGIHKKLYESLKEKNFFHGKTVFIDGYYNFTKAEYPIVEMIFKGATDTYITILYDEKEKSGIFDVNKEALSLTERMFQGITDIYPQSKRERTENLSFLEKNLFTDTKEKPLSDGSVSVIACKTPYEESLFIAEEITRLVKNGYRYKDICVSMRDNSRLEGFLDTALNGANIPFYSADKDSLTSKELSSLILSLLEISFTDWSTASVIRYASSSFSPLDRKEADLLTIYAESWRIKGRRWYNSDTWLMNPSGYKTTFSKREEEMLSVVNSAREKLLFALEAYTTDLKSKNLTIAKGVRAIYNHLIHIKADKLLEEKVNILLEKGEDDEASKITSLWDNVMSILNTLYETAGDVKVTAKRLFDLLRLMMDEYKLGALPSYADSIEVGNASIMRPSHCKVMIVSGMNDGVFPSSPEATGLFSNAEKEFLRSVGIESETLPDEFMKNENLLFYNLCATPTSKLILTYCENSAVGKSQRMSVFAETVLQRFGEGCFKRYKANLKRKNPRKHFDVETFSDKFSLTPSTPDVLWLSSSKIEKYLKCPFSYYCDYVLALKKFDKAELTAGDAGTYYHSIVENFAKSLFETGEFKGKNDDEIKDFLQTAKENYKEKVFHKSGNERENYSFDCHEEILFPLLKNINDEFATDGFKPVGFEEKVYSSYPITDKTTAKMSGIADRIDLLEKDGKKYLRIVDYKKGKRTISEKDVKNGLEMQMLTYLFSRCQNGEIPAGVMYFICGRPPKNEKPFRRNGLILDESEVKSEMTFLVKNEHLKKSDFVTSEALEELKTAVAENVCKVGKSIIDGKMDIQPRTLKSKSPCTYCSAKLYCRKKLTEE